MDFATLESWVLGLNADQFFRLPLMTALERVTTRIAELESKNVLEIAANEGLESLMAKMNAFVERLNDFNYLVVSSIEHLDLVSKHLIPKPLYVPRVSSDSCYGEE